MSLPASEVELYQKRFELLLGGWERAKGNRPMNARIKRPFWHMLMVLAFQTHDAGMRYADQEAAVEVARDYCTSPELSSGSDMIDDCVLMGLLERDSNRTLSFGHLTYQEYMAGSYLAHRNVASDIWKRIDDPWWRKSIEFYAELQGDISRLVRFALRARRRGAKDAVLLELLQIASLTPEDVRYRIERAISS